jgi:hypothetical protein
MKLFGNNAGRNVEEKSGLLLRCTRYRVRPDRNLPLDGQQGRDGQKSA